MSRHLIAPAVIATLLLAGCGGTSLSPSMQEQRLLRGGDNGRSQQSFIAMAATHDLASIDSRPDRLSVLSFNLEHRDRPRELEIMADRLRTDIAEIPDIILLQEVMFERSESKGEASTAEVLAAALDFYCKGTKRTSDREGVAIASRFPFLYYAERHLEDQTSRLLLGFNRVSVLAEFDVPDVGRVRAVNVHLTNWDFDAAIRRRQLEETLRWAAARQAEAPADVVILGGDFNIQPGSPDLGLIQNLDIAGVAFVSHHNPNTDTRGKGRVDYIFTAEPRAVAVLTPLREHALWSDGIPISGTDSRLRLSDHIPVLQEFTIDKAAARRIVVE